MVHRHVVGLAYLRENDRDPVVVSQLSSQEAGVADYAKNQDSLTLDASRGGMLSLRGHYFRPRMTFRVFVERAYRTV